MKTVLLSLRIRAADLCHTSNDMGFPSVPKGDKLHPPPRIIKKTEGPRSDEIYQRPNFETYVDTWRYTLPWGVKIIVSTAAFKTYSYSKT